MISIVTRGSSLVVVTPYHPHFPKVAKTLGGKWDAGSRAWTFDPRDEQRVRDLCIDVFGTDGDPNERLVTVRITALKDLRNWCAPIYFAGREVAFARGRDSGGRPSEGTVLLSGKLRSAGSMRNWYTVIDAGTALEVRDIPYRAVEPHLTEEDGDEWRVEILDPETEQVKALLAEKAALEARLAEVISLLGSKG